MILQAIGILFLGLILLAAGVVGLDSAMKFTANSVEEHHRQ